MAEKKKDNNLLYLLLGLGVVGGLYFFTKKKDETVEKEEKPTSDVGNGKNDKPEIKRDDLGQPKVLPGKFGYDPDMFKRDRDIIFDTGTLPKGVDIVNTGVVQPKEPTFDFVTTSASSGKKSSPIVETVNFTV